MNSCACASRAACSICSRVAGVRAPNAMFSPIVRENRKISCSIVAICDVSKSVAAAAQFLLTFLYSLNEVVDRLDAFAFSGRLIPVNRILDDHGVDKAILEVLQQIKSDEKLKLIPVVVLTSSREERDMVSSYQLGVNAYVVKPVDFHEFVNAIKELGVFWAIINEPPPGSVRKER